VGWSPAPGIGRLSPHNAHFFRSGRDRIRKKPLRYFFPTSPSHLAPTFWIGIAPVAIRRFPKEVIQVLSVAVKAIGVSFCGFAIIVTMLHYSGERFSFAMSW